MLVRRQARLALMRALMLGSMNVESHTNGSVTVMVRQRAGLRPELMTQRLDELESRVAQVVQETTHEDVLRVRRGIKGRVTYITVTTERMREQSGRGARRGTLVLPAEAEGLAGVLTAIAAELPSIDDEAIPEIEPGETEPLEESELAARY